MPHPNYLILQACKKGDAAALDKLLSNGAKWSQLGLAINDSLPNAALVEVFLDHGLDPNFAFNDYNETLIYRAVGSNHRATFDLLVQRGARLDVVTTFGYDLLHQAAGGGHPDMAAALLKHGIDVNIRTPRKSTPLIEAARNNHVPVMELLLAHGANIHARDAEQTTALILAAKAGKFEAAEWLVRHGADVNARDEHRKTALDWARENSRVAVVELLQPPGSAPFVPAQPAPAIPAPTRSPAAAATDPSLRFVEGKLRLADATELKTEDGGKLVIQPESTLSCRFSFGIKEAEEEVDVLHSIVRLVDDQGTVWLAESIWSVGEIAGETKNFGAVSPPQKFSSLTPARQAAFESACFFKGARALLDDRSWYSFPVEGVVYRVRFKYQAPTLDLSFLEGLVFARVNGFQAEASDPSKPWVPVPPFIFAVDVLKRLLVNYGYEDEELGCWEFDLAPRPLILKKSGEREKPQPLVQYRKK